MIRAVTFLAASLAFGGARSQAQETASTPPALPRTLGEVTAIDAGARQLTLKTDAGDTVTVRSDEKTSFVRAQPGARDLSGATPVALGDIAVGDRVLARGTMPAGEKVMAARQVVVMARADIAQRHEQDQAEWRRRGVSGVITAVDPARQEFTVEVRSLASAQVVTVAGGEGNPAFKRYAPGSVRFSDARASTFADLRVGDQVRVLGNRSEDGARVTAEQVVSGSFQTVSGAVKTVQGNTVTLVDNETQKPISVTVGPEAMVRRLPTEMAARLAMRTRGPGAPAAGAGTPAGAPPAGTTAPGAGGAGAWQGRRPGAGGPPNAAGRAGGTGSPGAQTLQELLERLPALPLDQLKPGDQVAVSSAQPDDPTRLTAVVLVAGIEPLLQARPRAGRAGGGETLGLSPGALDMGMGIE